jgi:hypothetical protein
VSPSEWALSHMGGSASSPEDVRVELLADGKVRFTHLRRAFTVYDLTTNSLALKRVPHEHPSARWRAFIAEYGSTKHCSLVGWKVPRDLSGRTLERQLEAAHPGLPVLTPPPQVVDEDTDESWMDELGAAASQATSRK